MPLSNRYRRLSVAPMAHLERRGRGALGGGVSSGRIQHSFPEGSHFIQGAHPFFGLLSQIHQGQSLSAGGGVSAPEGSHRAGSTSFTGLLQPIICSDEGLRVVATSDRSFSFEPQGVENTFQDGDTQVHSVVSPQGGLDGLHRSQRCISSDSNTSGIQEISEVHGLREGIQIQGPLLWSVHGPAGLHAGHGSGFGNSSQSWHLSSTLSGQLADSGVLQGAGSPGSGDCPSSMQLSGDCCQLGEISACSDSKNLLSGSPFGFNKFQGFSSPETSRQAALNWRRVSIVRGAACKILAGVAGGSVLSNSAHSGRSAADAVVPVCSSSSLGSSGSRGTRTVVSRNLPRFSLVVEPRAARARNLPRASVSPARLVVRRLGCRVGGSPRRAGRFRPVVSRGAPQLHKSSGAVGGVLCSPTLPSSGSQHRSGGICGQYDSSGLPEESGRYQIRSPEPDGSGAAAVGGAPFCHASSTIYHGAQQCFSGCAISPKSDSRLRVDLKTLSFSTASEEMASGNRSVRNLSKSPLLTIFFSLPRSKFHRDRCSSPTVRWVAGLCLSSICSNSCNSKEAPLVLWGPADNHSSLLAPEGVVSGAPGVSGGRASGSASGQGSVEPALCTSATSGSVKASSSCLETIQRFVRSCGFSRHVAKQTALAGRPSSRAGYQAKWSVYRKWCTSDFFFFFFRCLLRWTSKSLRHLSHCNSL